MNTGRRPCGAGMGIKIIGAIAVAEVVELPRLALGGHPTPDRLLIDEHVNHADIASKIVRIGVGFGQLGGRHLDVVLG